MLFLFGCSNGHIGSSEATVRKLSLVALGSTAPLQPYQSVFDRFFSSVGKASVHHQLTCFKTVHSIPIPLL